MPPSTGQELEADERADTEQDAHGRPGERDVEFLLPVLRHLRELGDAAEQPEADRLYLDAVAAGDQRVAEFVEDDTDEETDGGECPHGERHLGAPGERARSDVRTQGVVENLGPALDLDADDVGEQGKDEQERQVQFDGDVEQATDAETLHAGP